MNMPNRLTLSRIILAPVFVIIFLLDSHYCRIGGFIIFILAAVTDFADGHYARKYGIVTGFGKFMDPLADKILVTSAFLVILSLDYARTWMIALIVAREFYITGLRSLAAYRGAIITPSNMAKLKTTLQMITIIFILLIISLDSSFKLNPSPVQTYLQFDRHLVFDIMIGITAAVTIYTGLDYTVKYYSVLRNILK